MTTITIWSEGGGCGKTTTTVNLAAALGRLGYDVVGVDFDPQPGSLTDHAGYPDLKDEDEPHATIVDALLSEDIGLEDILVTGEFYDVVPAHESLANLESRASDAGVSMAEFLLRPALEPLTETYDFVLVDPPATLNLLVDNALIASDAVLVPAEMTRKGEQSVKGVYDTVDALESQLQAVRPDFSLEMLGVLPNKYSDSTLNQEIRAKLDTEGDVELLDRVIPDYNVVEDAWDGRHDIFSYDESVGLRPYQEDLLDAYMELAESLTGDELDNESADEESLTMEVTVE